MSFAIRAGLWILAIVGIGAAGWAAVATYRGAIEDAAVWEARAGDEKLAAEGWKAAAAFWQEEKRRADRAVAARDAERTAINRREKEANDALRDHIKSDPAIKAWADARLPLVIASWLRNLGTDSATVPTATPRNPAEPDAADRDPAVRGRIER